MKTLVIAVALLAGAFPVQDMPEAKPLEQHEWLQQLVGEWTVTMEASMGPDVEPMRMEGTESVRSIGGLWILGEGSATLGGKHVASILTLGYDPRRKAFVGSWIDTVQTHMWSYVGTLDEARKVLTLDTEGPAFDDPTKNAKYRDAIELEDRDHKVLTSSLQDEKGNWTAFMRAEYRRKR